MTNRAFKVHCADTYEAEKLASLLSGGRESRPSVRAVAALHGDEIVLRLTDESSHSVVLKDAGTASDLKQVLKDLLERGGKVKRSASVGDAVELELES